MLLISAVGLAGCYVGPAYDGGYDGGYGYAYSGGPGYYAYSPPSVSFSFGGDFGGHHHGWRRGHWGWHRHW
ncbi:MAG: hypothetical protein IRY94_04800 [Rhodospirillaceae bacterium]|nr:hypothetical protein [Rhodospirillaceae bacterium]